VTSRRIVPREAAERDIDNIVSYYVQEAGEKTALDFIDELERTFAHVARHPNAGSSRYAYELDLPGLRCWSLKRFPYSVFYVETDDRIDVWRILHSSRDIPAWMSAEI
jgi:toxin ParE1/3/4